MSSLNPVKTIVEGIDIRMVLLQDILNTSDGSAEDISRIMISVLEKDLWPEPFIRNHPTLSAPEQIRLLKSRVVIVGLGGLGGHLATLMARIGTGHLVLVDGDKYDPSNLNRQVLCTIDTIDKSKADVAAQQCRLINPALVTTVRENDLNSENGNQVLASADLVLDGLDQISTRKMLFSLAMSMGIPFVHGAVQGWYGQTATFMPESPSDLDGIYPGEPPQTTPPSVLAPVVATIASLQTQEAVRILTGRAPVNSGMLAYFDGHEMSLHRLSL